MNRNIEGRLSPRGVVFAGIALIAILAIALSSCYDPR